MHAAVLLLSANDHGCCGTGCPLVAFQLQRHHGQLYLHALSPYHEQCQSVAHSHRLRVVLFVPLMLSPQVPSNCLPHQKPQRSLLVLLPVNDNAELLSRRLHARCFPLYDISAGALRPSFQMMLKRCQRQLTHAAIFLFASLCRCPPAASLQQKLPRSLPVLRPAQRPD
jgi:hypothetical protein